MSSRSIIRWAAIIVGVVVFNAIIAFAQEAPTQSDGRSLRWDRFDVTINAIEHAANRFQVTEDYRITVERGPFSFGFAEIPLGRVGSITNVTVSEDGVALRESCGYGAGTYCVTREGDTLGIQYYFRSPVSSGQGRAIRLSYTVSGALRKYDAGDELFWVALPGELSFPVQSSRVEVILPEGTPILAVTSYPDSWTQTVEGQRITWVSPPRPSDEGTFEVRVKIPHDPAMPKPGWQTRYDLEQSYIDNVRPIVTALIAALSVLLGFGGSLFVLSRYVLHGRDPATVTVPEYLDTPPSDERPGIVGLLLDEKADMQDIMATLVDLAQRGYLVIEQDEKSLAGFFKRNEFAFVRTEKPLQGLTPYETRLINGIFQRGRERTELDQLKTKFYQHIGPLKSDMYKALVSANYFTRSPETTRNIWLAVGIGGLVVASLLFWGSRQVPVISPALWLLPVALGLASATALLLAEAMPAKTVHGAQQAALWRAFKRYLANIDRHKDLAAARERFDQYMPYAIAFGVEKEFVRDIAPALTAMPGWYRTPYLYGPPYRPLSGRPAGSPIQSLPGRPGGGLGDFGPGGVPNLESMNRSLGEGLSSLNKGLTQMLNEASRAMTSRPQNKSGGGGGFSGGGRGGGSGGGSRGFG